MLDQHRVTRADDYLSLLPILQRLWLYRRVMVLSLLVVVVVFLASVVGIYLRAPAERIATLGFRLTFEGAENGQFPNGTKFSAAEIVSTPVLAEVFKKNQLDQYFSYSDFKQRMFVVEADRDLELLAYEYAAKLSDPRLSPVDRARIEEEFRTKRESLKSAEFALNMRAGGRLARIPEAVLSKVLQDTVSTWAWHAAERKGAIRYDIPVLSKNAINKQILTSEDPVIAVDMLRSTVLRMLKTIADIWNIPGAAAVRIGKEQVSLEDIRVNLEDLQRFQIEPLVGLITANGLSRSGSRMDLYFQGRLVEVQLERQEAERRIRTLQDALREYQQRSASPLTTADGSRNDAVAPQLSESFIDRLLDLSTRSSDIEFRQGLTNRIIQEGLAVAELNKQTEYYDLMKKTSGSVRQGGNAAAEAEVSRRSNLALTEILTAMDQVQAIYKLIGEQNLNPDTVLYAITRPFSQQRTSPVSARALGLYLLMAVVATLLVVPFACLVHAYVRERILPPGSPRAPSASEIAGV